MSLRDSDAWQGPYDDDDPRSRRPREPYVPPPRIVRRNIVIKGVVQGVGFRYKAQQEAHRLGLVGWVKNRLDGAVEIEAQGPVEQVDEMVALMWLGTRWSRVDNIDVTPLNPLPEGEAETAFLVARTY